MTMPSLERKNQPVVVPSDKMDDHSGTFHTLRAKLIDNKGRRYLDLVRALRPNYARVCRDIALGYGMLTASCFLTVWLPFQGAASMLTIVVGSVLIGYWIAYLQLFIHEGAHFNLAQPRPGSSFKNPQQFGGCPAPPCWLFLSGWQQSHTPASENGKRLGSMRSHAFPTYRWIMSSSLAIQGFS